MDEAKLEQVIIRLERVLELAERVLCTKVPAWEPSLDDAIAFRWQRREGVGHLRPVRHVDAIRLQDLFGIDKQLATLVRNTRQFLLGAPANHVLLWGERGTGKSSAVKAVLNEFHSQGLRLVEVYRRDLLDLPDIIDLLWDRPEKFILFCDDLSFEEDDAEYKELKALLEGGICARPTNMLVYATSNRRHLMPTSAADRALVSNGDEMHQNDTYAEKLSLADRFGIRLGFYAIDQETYLNIARHLAKMCGLPVDDATLKREAIRWSQNAAGRSGRSARQFMDDLQGRLMLEGAKETV